MGEYFGEGASPRPPIPGEGGKFFDTAAPSISEVIKDKKLSFEEASKCLNTLGKDESGSRYAYLTITAVDRKLTDISIILKFKHVLFLDLSGNYLTKNALEILTEMPFLILLKAERNRVESANLKPMHYLQVLDLNQNQIKNIENIQQPVLECLELNFNDIYSTNFDTTILNNLKQLELRSNLLFEISGGFPPNLEKLYMAGNKITTINSNEFSKLKYLQILHLRDNNLQKLDGFSENLSNLEYLNLRNNQINKLREFKKLQNLPKLEILIISGNPLSGSEENQQPGEGSPGEGGRILDPMVLPILAILPKLKRINKTPITMDIRIEAEDIQNVILETLLRDDDEIGSNLETDRESSSTNPPPSKEESTVE